MIHSLMKSLDNRYHVLLLQSLTLFLYSRVCVVTSRKLDLLSNRPSYGHITNTSLCSCLSESVPCSLTEVIWSDLLRTRSSPSALPAWSRMELKVWVDGVVRVVCGLSEETSCQDVVIALAQAIGALLKLSLLWYHCVVLPNKLWSCLFVCLLKSLIQRMFQWLDKSPAVRIYCKQNRITLLGGRGGLTFLFSADPNQVLSRIVRGSGWI